MYADAFRIECGMMLKERRKAHDWEYVPRLASFSEEMRWSVELLFLEEVGIPALSAFTLF